jgi:hypothetical protein
MAAIVRFFENPSVWGRRHETEVEIESREGRLLQLDTFGSKDRKLVGKKSQTMQFDADAARQLLTIIRRAFPDVV